MNKTYSFDAITNTLTATATFLRKASIFNSVEYNIVKGIRADYPNVSIVKAVAKKSKAQRAIHRIPLTEMPCYKLVFSYTGNVSPQNVKSFVFQIDDKMYQLIPSEGQTSINQFNEYVRQFEFLIDNSNIVFMEALTATQKTVRVEIRGDGFVLSFDMPSKSKKMLTEDWSLFKKAGGAADVYLMHSGAQMNVR